MAEATWDEQNNLAALNGDRNKERENPETEQSSGPNIVIYIFMEGLIGLPGDLLRLIPVVGAILAFPFSAAMWFWRAMSSRFKNSPLQKILTNGILEAIPFTNTFFLTSCYLEETKLGKTIMSKVSKTTKLIK